jgi:FkbM family methyltransferase
MKLLNPALQVLASEPVEENMDLLGRNIAANGLTGVEAVQAAVSASAGEATLETYPHVGTIASRDIGAFPRPWVRPRRIRRRRVPAVTLSGLLARAGIDHAQLLKVDIEGSEVDVLSGDPAVLQRFERIVVECHGEEARRRCIDIVSGQGFEAVHIEQKRSGDVYFEAP